MSGILGHKLFRSTPIMTITMISAVISFVSLATSSTKMEPVSVMGSAQVPHENSWHQPRLTMLKVWIAYSLCIPDSHISSSIFAQRLASANLS